MRNEVVVIFGLFNILIGSILGFTADMYFDSFWTLPNSSFEWVLAVVEFYLILFGFILVYRALKK